METNEEQQQKQHGRRIHPPAPRLDPWLIYSHGKCLQHQTFFSISEGRYYNKSIPELRGKYICTCAYGWLVLVDSYSDDCYLLNPVSMEKIQLPECNSFCYALCVLSSPPHNPSCIVMLFGKGDKIMFCRPGDNKWTKQELEPKPGIVSVIGYNEKIYGLTISHNQFVMVDVGESVTIRKVEAEQLPAPLLGRACVRNLTMVESGGELFALHKILFHCQRPRIVCDMEVLKMDFSRMIWERVESLGERAFFWSQSCCTSCSAKECGIKENTVYFTEPDDRSLYAFDLEDGGISVSLPCPNVKSHWLQPEWVMPLV